jgi:hypothetical protein
MAFFRTDCLLRLAGAGIVLFALTAPLGRNWAWILEPVGFRSEVTSPVGTCRRFASYRYDPAGHCSLPLASIRVSSIAFTGRIQNGHPNQDRFF